MRLRPLIVALLAALLVAFPLSALAAPPPPPRMAYVDMDRVLLEVDEGKAAKARVQKWMDDRQKEFDTEQEALRKEKELLDKQTSTLKPEVAAQRAAALQQKVVALTQKWEKYRAEATQRERKEMEPILGKIDQIVANIAQRDGFNWVVDKRFSGLIYADKAYDLTNEVIRSYNAPAPAKK
jgi:outer membrane protein